MRFRISVLIFPAFVSSCYSRPGTLGDPCVEDGDCDDMQVCVENVCASVENDGESGNIDGDSGENTEPGGEGDSGDMSGCDSDVQNLCFGSPSAVFLGVSVSGRSGAVQAGEMDGKVGDDLFVLASDSSVAMVSSQGDGTFSDAVNSEFDCPVGVPTKTVTTVVSGPFANNDSLTDFAVGMDGSGENIAVFSFSDSGEARIVDCFGFGGFAIAAITVANFSGNDSIPDVIVYVMDGTQNFVALSEGDGSGFSNAMTTLGKVGGVSAWGEMSAGNFNDDEFEDVVLVAESGLHILLGTGGASVAGMNSGELPGAGSASTILAYDINADEVDDVIVVKNGGLYVGTGNGDGSAPTLKAKDLGVDRKAASVAVVDMDGNGSPDVLVGTGIQGSSGELLLLLNDGSGELELTEYPLLSTSYRVSWLVSGDFNGDERPDVALPHASSDRALVLLSM